MLKEKITNITNSDYPSKNTPNGRDDRTLMIIPIDDDITQIRLDMIEFEMNLGSQAQSCQAQYVEISLPDENVRIQRLCGNNKGQHLYIHLPEPSNNNNRKIDVRLHFSGRRKYKYNIKVTQVNNL